MAVELATTRLAQFLLGRGPPAQGGGAFPGGNGCVRRRGQAPSRVRIRNSSPLKRSARKPSPRRKSRGDSRPEQRAIFDPPELGLATDKRRVPAAEQGISEMMVDLYRSFSEPLSELTCCSSWHDSCLGIVEASRISAAIALADEAMEVIPAPYMRRECISRPRHHPASQERWRASLPGSIAPAWGSEPLPALTRAGIAHLYFESIHPFEDGNGRIGRAIAEKALAQCFGQPTLIALAATILSRRKAYYAALEAANKGNEVTAWLSWFAGIAIEAQRRTTARVEFLIEKTRLLGPAAGSTESAAGEGAAAHVA